MDFHRRLEHSSREGAAYFVTWRLEGSLPVARIAEFWTTDGPKFVECDRLLDAVSTGPRWLERPDIASIVANVILSGERQSRYELGAWVVMPNHVHAALRPMGDNDLGTTINSIKGRSAREANRSLNRAGLKFWSRDYFDRRIRDRDHEARVVRYIENNPVKAGLCGSATDWPWSSPRRKNAPEVACTNCRRVECVIY
jgi:putative transposase